LIYYDGLHFLVIFSSLRFERVFFYLVGWTQSLRGTTPIKMSHASAFFSLSLLYIYLSLLYRHELVLAFLPTNGPFVTPTYCTILFYCGSNIVLFRDSLSTRQRG
jgi:hypothetical protein